MRVFIIRVNSTKRGKCPERKASEYRPIDHRPFTIVRVFLNIDSGLERDLVHMGCLGARFLVDNPLPNRLAMTPGDNKKHIN